MELGEGPEVRLVRSEAEFAEVLAVRRAVFVAEQGGPLQDEPDAWDPLARHFMVRVGCCVVGTARLYEPEPGVGKIGRVALLPEYRGRGWAARLLREVLKQARAEQLPKLILDAQTTAVGLYERFGFAVEGEEFLDAGLPHLRMTLQLLPSPETNR